jgi:O-antigen ligase
MRPLLFGVMLGIVAAASYGLATRLFPAQLGVFDSIAAYRLSEPLGYWNGLGLFAAIGTLLGVGFAARARSLVARGIGSAVPIFLVPVIYFTFGRAAWIALALGLVASIALDFRRIQLVTVVLVLTPFVAIAVWLCTREPDLNRRASVLTGATAEGRRLGLELLGLAALSCLVGPALEIVASKVSFSRMLRLTWAGMLVALLLVTVAVGVSHYGGPREVVSRAYDSFRAPPRVKSSSTGNLNRRLFSLSNNGRLDQWKVAVDDFKDHPFLGSGAGTYEFLWLKDRPRKGKVRDAHNLYLEVLAELGPIGLALLVFTLAVPVFASLRVRRHPFVSVALGAYIAYLSHAAVDWDWEMPAVTIAGLLCGCAILVVARENPEGRALTPRFRVLALTGIILVSSFSFIGLMGNLAIASSNKAKSSGNWARADSQAGKAKIWMPWSSLPWILQGEAQYLQYKDKAARANFEVARKKDPNNWVVYGDLATVSPHGAWRAPARRALKLNPLAPELAALRQALGRKP